jgi:hypothetical protein
MEIRSVYAMPRALAEYRGHVRIHDARIIHWVAVVILVISQFTLIPMLAIITADTHRSVSHSVRSDVGPAGSNITTIFKDLPTLSP